MKRFAFTLEKMLKYKTSLYERERNELGRLRREKAELEQQRDMVLRQMREMEDQFHEKAAQGVTMDEIQKLGYYRENADRYVHILDDKIVKKDREIEKQLVIVVQLDKDVKGLEKLKEKQWEEYVADSNREEKERILELVSFKFLETQNELELEELAEAQAKNS